MRLGENEGLEPNKSVDGLLLEILVLDIGPEFFQHIREGVRADLDSQLLDIVLNVAIVIVVQIGNRKSPEPEQNEQGKEA